MLDLAARDELRRVLAPYAPPILRVALFGSRATGRARANSDIDLILYGDINQDILDRLYTLFEDSDLPVTVDLVAYSPDLPALLRRHIDSFAVPLFDRDDLRVTHVRAAA